MNPILSATMQGKPDSLGRQGQEYMLDYIQKHNAGILWDKLSANQV